MNKYLPPLKKTTGAHKHGPGRHRRLSFFLWIRDCAIKSFHKRAGIGLTATMLSTASQGADFTVDTLSDDAADGFTLREAIMAANANSETDAIAFDPALSGTLTLTQGELPISSDLSIAGLATSPLVISGNEDSRIFNITSGSNISLSKLTLSNGSAFRGGAILNNGNLTITNSTISGNYGGYAGGGGGIYNSGTGNLTVTNSTISGNSSGNYGVGGGGIANSGGNLTIINSTISGNATTYGGGIYSSNGSLTITNSIIAGNGARYSNDLENYTPTTIYSGINLFGTDGLGDAEDLIETDPTNIFANTAELTTPVTTADPFTGATLSDNGGPVATILILAGGPAHNAGDNSALPSDELDLDEDGDTAETLPVDTSGLARIVATTVDIGAIELADNNPAPFELVECALSTPTFDSTGGVILNFTLDTNAPAGTSWILRRSLTLDDFDTVDPIFTFDGSSVTLEEDGNTSNLNPSDNVFTITDVDPPASGAFYRLEVE